MTMILIESGNGRSGFAYEGPDWLQNVRTFGELTAAFNGDREAASRSITLIDEWIRCDYCPPEQNIFLKHGRDVKGNLNGGGFYTADGRIMCRSCEYRLWAQSKQIPPKRQTATPETARAEAPLAHAEVF